MTSVWECLILPYENKLEGKPGFCLEWVNFYYSQDVVLLHVSQSQKEQLERYNLLRERSSVPGANAWDF